MSQNAAYVVPSLKPVDIDGSLWRVSFKPKDPLNPVKARRSVAAASSF